jgi:hypothetical protein
MKFGRFIGDCATRLPLLGRFARDVALRSRARRARFGGQSGPAAGSTVSAWLEERWSALQPLSVFPTPSSGPRLSVVTDSVGPASLFGGVGTALVLSALLADRIGATLRLITRNDPPDASAVGAMLEANRVTLHMPLETVFAPVRGGRQLPVSESDYFLSTSWWTTRALLSSVRRERLAYLLQEDERMFYPHGDDRVRCWQTMCEPGLSIVVNSRLLFDHLATGHEPIPALAHSGAWFEPAFPAAGRALPQADGTGRRKLFFYARPNNLRNLFCTGLEALSAAIADGTLHPAEWDIYLVGKDVPDLVFPRGVRPQRIAGLNWAEYHALVASMDAGIVLMDTPHPSYPPLDLAAHGAAVLTNEHGAKTDLSCYSRNILLARPDAASLARGIDELVALARDRTARRTNLVADSICRDWTAALAPVIDRLAGQFQAGTRRRAAHIHSLSPAA